MSVLKFVFLKKSTSPTPGAGRDVRPSTPPFLPAHRPARCATHELPPPCTASKEYSAVHERNVVVGVILNQRPRLELPCATPLGFSRAVLGHQHSSVISIAEFGSCCSELVRGTLPAPHAPSCLAGCWPQQNHFPLTTNSLRAKRWQHAGGKSSDALHYSTCDSVAGVLARGPKKPCPW